MREALARADHDFVLAEPEPRRPRPRPRDKRFGAFSRVLRLARCLVVYPNRVAGGLLVAFILAIIVNALVLQKSRHPAPLFGKSIALPSLSAPTPSSRAVAPQPSPSTQVNVPAVIVPPQALADPIGQLLQSHPESAPVTAAPDKSIARPEHREPPAHEVRSTPVREPSRNDAISALLRSQPSQAPVQASKTVAAAQRALVKLGFVLKPDGRMGTATRQALEQFERDRGLHVHDGELSPKVLRQLSAAAGVPVD